MQIMPNSRRTTLAQMGDAVVTFTDQRVGKRRFMAYTFANDLALVADSGTSKAEFVRQIIAIKPQTATIQLYKTAFRQSRRWPRRPATARLSSSWPTAHRTTRATVHDQVVKAAKDAGVVIHVLASMTTAMRVPSSRSSPASPRTPEARPSR
jgi:hypothetical protein